MVQSSEVMMEESPEEEREKQPQLERPEPVTMPGAEAAPAAARPKTTRRAALRIVREAVEKASKDITNLSKNSEVSTTRLQKQLSGLRNDLATLKSHVTRETERIQQKQSVLLSKILSKLTTQKAVKKSKPTSAPTRAPRKKVSTSASKPKTKAKRTR